MSFKGQLAKDIHDVFLNLDEFAEKVVIDGREMAANVEDIQNTDRDGRYVRPDRDGVYVRHKTVAVAAVDYGGELPIQGQLISLNGQRYKVAEASNDLGLFVIVLEDNEEV